MMQNGRISCLLVLHEPLGLLEPNGEPHSIFSVPTVGILLRQGVGAVDGIAKSLIIIVDDWKAA